jgi:predicted metal-dependent peptidase
MSKTSIEKIIEDEISKSIIKLLIDEPFYAHVLSGVSRKISDEIPTAAVGLIGSTITLFINKEFFQKSLTTASSKVAVIKHEVLHIVLRHIFRQKEKEYDPYLYNLAADLVVNQYIGKWKLPKDAITLDTFPNLKLDEGETLEWYYYKLLGYSNNSKEGSDFINSLNDNPSHSDHSLWGKSNKSDLDSAEITFGKLIIDAKKRTGAKEYGKLPFAIKNTVELEIEKQNEQVDWKSAVKLFYNSSKKTFLKYTYKRKSKRYGTRPGIKIKQHTKLLVALDTSGSISQNEFSLFFNEINGIWKTGTEIDVIECDNLVQNKYAFNGTIPKYIHGRGGTNFSPVFKYLNENRNINYDGCIYLTDGYAVKPSVKPYCPVIWVISKEGLIDDHLWFGRTTRLKY